MFPPKSVFGILVLNFFSFSLFFLSFFFFLPTFHFPEPIL